MMTEFVGSHGVGAALHPTRQNKSLRFHRFQPDERPISAQLFGCDPQVTADASGIRQGFWRQRLLATFRRKIAFSDRFLSFPDCSGDAPAAFPAPAPVERGGTAARVRHGRPPGRFRC